MVLLPLLLAGATSARAGTDGKWEVGSTTYVWFAGFKGDLRSAGEVEPISVDLSFSDILEHLKFAGMAMIKARRDRLVLMGDIGFVSLGAKKGIGIRDPDLVDADLDSSTLSATALAGYRIADSGVALDLLGGARLTRAVTKLELAGPSRSIEGDVTEAWIDPIIAAHVGIPVARHTTLSVYGDVGGFGTSSDLTWQTALAVQQDISQRWRLSGGWRILAVDYDKGSFLYDVKQSGPIVGVQYAF